MSDSVQSVSLNPSAYNVALAMALLWTWRPGRDIHALLRVLGLNRADGRAFILDDVKQAFQALRGHGVLLDQPGRDGYVRLHDKLRVPLYRKLLETYPGPALRDILFAFVGYHPNQRNYYWTLGQASTVALLRLALLSGLPEAEFKRIAQSVQNGQSDWDGLLHAAILDGFDEVGSLVQGLMGSSVEPGDAAAHDVHV